MIPYGSKPRALREGLQPAPDQPDGAGAGSLSRAGLGTALDAVLPGVRPPAEKLTDWVHQRAVLARRWLLGREIVVVGDSGFAVLKLLSSLARHKRIGITRLRLDAALRPGAARRPGTNGRPRTKGGRLPNTFGGA